MNTITDITLPHSVRFAEKWIEWVNYRKALKKPYKTQKGITMALNQLKGVSEQEAIDMMDNSMRNEYQGLFEKKKEKEEIPQSVAWLPEKTPVSQEPAKPFNPELGLQNIREKLKRNYETGVNLNDFGEVYTNRLRGLITIPSIIEEKIKKEVGEEASEPRKNRFEPPNDINVEFEVRNRILNHFLSTCRKQQRDISLEI